MGPPPRQPKAQLQVPWKGKWVSTHLEQLIAADGHCLGQVEYGVPEGGGKAASGSVECLAALPWAQSMWPLHTTACVQAQSPQKHQLAHSPHLGHSPRVCINGNHLVGQSNLLVLQATAQADLMQAHVNMEGAITQPFGGST